MKDRLMDADRFGKTVMLITGSAAALMMLYAAVRHGFSELAAPTFALYYGCPLAILLTSIALLRRPVGVRANAALLVLSLGGGAYMGEGLVRLQGWAQTPSSEIGDECRRAWQVRICRTALDQGGSFDTRSKLEVLDALADSAAAWPFLPGAHQPVSPAESAWASPEFALSGMANATIVWCNEGGDWITYRSDEFGFRNPPGSHRAGVQVALLGDSFTQGYCVEEGYTVAGQLRAAGASVLNLGISGTGPLNSLAVLREYAAPLAPPVVFWLFYDGNDFENLNLEAQGPRYRPYLDSSFSRGLRERQSEIDEYLRQKSLQFIVQERERLRLSEITPPPEALHSPVEVALGFTLLRRLRSFLSRTDENMASVFQNRLLLHQVLSAADEAVRSWGGTMYFVYLPTQNTLAGRPEFQQQRTAVLEVVRSVGIPWIDGYEVLAAHPDPASLFPYRLGSHYTPEGYALVANLLRATLLDAPGPRIGF